MESSHSKEFSRFEFFKIILMTFGSWSSSGDVFKSFHTQLESYFKQAAPAKNPRKLRRKSAKKFPGHENFFRFRAVLVRGEQKNVSAS